MRLKLFDRVVVCVLAFLILLLSICAIVAVFYKDTVADGARGFVMVMYGGTLNVIVTVVISVLLIFLCGRILFVRQKNEGDAPARGRDPSVLIKMLEGGSAFITIKAVEDIAMKFLRENSDIKAVKPTIVPAETGVMIGLKIALMAGVNIPEAVSGINDDLRAHLESVTGVAVREVQIIVDDSVADEQASKSALHA